MRKELHRNLYESTMFSHDIIQGNAITYRSNIEVPNVRLITRAPLIFNGRRLILMLVFRAEFRFSCSPTSGSRKCHAWSLRAPYLGKASKSAAMERVRHSKNGGRSSFRCAVGRGTCIGRIRREVMVHHCAGLRCCRLWSHATIGGSLSGVTMAL